MSSLGTLYLTLDSKHLSQFFPKVLWFVCFHNFLCKIQDLWFTCCSFLTFPWNPSCLGAIYWKSCTSAKELLFYLCQKSYMWESIGSFERDCDGAKGEKMRGRERERGDLIHCPNSCWVRTESTSRNSIQISREHGRNPSSCLLHNLQETGLQTDWNWYETLAPQSSSLILWATTPAPL